MQVMPFPLGELLDGSVYYPSSGFDGSPVKYFGSLFQTFIYVDYGYSRKQFREELVKNSFAGYQIIGIREVNATTNINGSAGNDQLTGTAENNNIDGSSGIDTMVLTSLNKNSVTLTHGTHWTVSSTSTGVDTLSNIERVQFQDTKVALDLDGHAGQVAKLLGAVFGPSSVTNKTYVGIGLSYLDGGMSYEALAALAVSVTGKSAPADVVNLLWTNVIGSAPSVDQAQPFIDMLNNGSSIGTLATLAADTSINQVNIDLVGLSQTGLEFA